MTVRAHMRGNPVVFIKGEWLYEDGEPTTIERPCTRCGKLPTPEGYDVCLGKVECATSVCCGHGVKSGYVYSSIQELQALETLRKNMTLIKEQHTMLTNVKYTGDEKRLQGKTALAMSAGVKSPRGIIPVGKVLIQADDRSTGLGYGWHEFPAEDWIKDVGG